MRDLFKGYYKPTPNGFSELWKRSTVILDTNVLLNLYRYSSETRDSLINILEVLKDRLWIPNHVAKEFHKNRLRVINDQAGAYNEMVSAVEQYGKQIENDLGKYKRHSNIKTSEMIKEVQGFFDGIKDKLNKQRATHPDYYREDIILEKITNLYTGRTGTPFSEDELLILGKAADARYIKSIPPGYLDAKNKQGDEKYGDFIIWSQILNYVQETKSCVVLVTDDVKEDWWWRVHGKTVGPRPELVEEMLKNGSKSFYMYRTDQFMEQAVSEFNISRSVPQESIQEARQLRVKDTVSQRFAERLESEYAEGVMEVRRVQKLLLFLSKERSKLLSEKESLVEAEKSLNNRLHELGGFGQDARFDKDDQQLLFAEHAHLKEKEIENSKKLAILSKELKNQTIRLDKIRHRIEREGRSPDSQQWLKLLDDNGDAIGFELPF